MPLPVRTDEQRRQDLAKATEARKKRADMKERLKRGELTLAQVLESDNEIIQTTRIEAILESLPGTGKVRAQKAMERIGIKTGRRVKGLGPNQRKDLLEEFSQ